MTITTMTMTMTMTITTMTLTIITIITTIMTTMTTAVTIKIKMETTLLFVVTGVCKINIVVIAVKCEDSIVFSTTDNNKNTVYFANTGISAVLCQL